MAIPPRRGERRTDRLLAVLERQGGVVLHDLAVPGSRANLDCDDRGRGGVLAIDSKHYQRQFQVDRDGIVWHGHHLLVSALRKTLWEADQADQVPGIADVQVAAIVAVHGASVPWGVLRAEGSPSSRPGGCSTSYVRCRPSLGRSG